ncbi:MAG: lipid A deacylase LpxR family protein [Pseudomonadales bacterium]|nr:lipid A deacylase LpxR family protein [Pseudomonadales bacterium]
MFVQSDNDYTNGLVFGWGHSPSETFEDLDIPDWIRYISEWTYINAGDDKTYSVSYGISQGMFTPTDISETELIPEDRPYAGLLTWQGRITSFDHRTANSLALTLGMAGPASLAEQSQKTIHKMTGSEEPMSWDNQIENEPVFTIDAEHIIRMGYLEVGEQVDVDGNFYSTAGLGNLRSEVGTGFVFRIGTQLDKDFAYVNPSPARRFNRLGSGNTVGFNWQIATALYGRYVFNDISIEGNTFKDSHGVTLIHEQAIMSIAFKMSWHNWGGLFTVQRGSDTFEEQDSNATFGAISFTYHH